MTMMTTIEPADGSKELGWYADGLLPAHKRTSQSGEANSSPLPLSHWGLASKTISANRRTFLLDWPRRWCRPTRWGCFTGCRRESNATVIHPHLVGAGDVTPRRRAFPHARVQPSIGRTVRASKAVIESALVQSPTPPAEKRLS